MKIEEKMVFNPQMIKEISSAIDTRDEMSKKSKSSEPNQNNVVHETGVYWFVIPRNIHET